MTLLPSRSSIGMTICAEASKQTLPWLVEHYVRPGRAKLELRTLHFIGRDSERAAHVDGLLDDDHVGARDHDLAHHRVVELEDRVDELAVVLLEHLELRGLVDHAEQLLLAREGRDRLRAARRDPVAERHEGVDKVYAMQAGREIRIMVAPDSVEDDGMALLSHEIAREIEKELEYPGQIKVTVIRESRAVEYAK